MVKRKQSTVHNHSRKRQKAAPRATRSEEYFKVRSIIDERPGEYLIDWEDHSRTGESYAPTWEPEAHITADTIQEWRLANAPPPSNDLPSGPATPGQVRGGELPIAAPASFSSSEVAKQRKKRGKFRTVVESSPEVSPKITRDLVQQNGVPAEVTTGSKTLGVEDEPEIVETQSAEAVSEQVDLGGDSPLFEPSEDLRPEPRVEPSDPPSSYHAGAYQQFTSSDLSSQTRTAQSVPVNFGKGSGKTIPDSQTVVDLTITSSAPQLTTSGRSDQGVASSQAEAVLETPARPVNSSAPSVLASGGTVLSQEQTAQSQADIESVVPAADQTAAVTSAHQELDSQATESQTSAEQILPPTFVGHQTDSQTIEPQKTADHTSSQSSVRSKGTTVAARPGAANSDKETHPPVVTSAFQTVETSKQATVAPNKTGYSRVASQDDSDLPRHSIEAASAQIAGDLRASAGRIFKHFATLGGEPPSETSTFPFQTQPSQHRQPLASSLARFVPTLDGPAASQVQVQTIDSNSSRIYTSSSIPSVPHYSPGTIGAKAPQHITILSGSSQQQTASPNTMSASQASAESRANLMAKLNASREARRQARFLGDSTSGPREHSTPVAKPRTSVNLLSQAPPKLLPSLVAEEQMRRSPSAIPAVEAPPIVTQQEMNTSERYETLVPKTRENGLHRSGSIAMPTLSRQTSKVEEPCASSAHVIPIALVGHQRDQYVATVHEGAELMQKFLTSSSPGSSLVAEAAIFVKRIDSITLHPDLVNSETFTQYQVHPKQQAQWDIDCSAKCRFLKSLLGDLRETSLHVVLISGSLDMLNILDTFLTGINVRHESTFNSGPHSSTESLVVTLALASDTADLPSPLPGDLVVVMDSALSPHASAIKVVRETPMVCLIVPYTVEHIMKSLSAATMTEEEQLRMTISGIQQYSHRAGSLDEGQAGIEDAAAELVTYLVTDRGERDWPLAPLEPIEPFDSATESDVEMPSAIDEQGPQSVTSLKRAHERSSSDIDPKRSRLDQQMSGDLSEAPLTIRPQDLEMTHISDSVTQAIPIGESLTTFSEAEESLRRMLREAQIRLDDHVQALSELQYRFEDQRMELSIMTNARDEAILTATKTAERQTSNESKMIAMQAASILVKEQLVTALARLADHTIPERADFERIRLQLEQAQSGRQQTEARYNRLTAEHEYLRSNYQTSSQSAQNLAGEVSDLETRLTAMTTKATGEQARLRGLGYDNQTTNLRKENKKLKVLLADREAALKCRDEEIARLKEASRGRMGTRATSVPRSPRVGSPMKMAMGGSRQGSPAPGELRGAKGGHLHPLRNEERAR
ncbi:hypothetical protein LTR62_008483 [Meristemomyces frigidus]|uniref:Chromo domain-containing protein n=1 Tax=Meristemomyces frigidus TaxID=1508187 RepID=A0AAN7THW5_9PEZI|nr:hypothetical protein LTR62_008483 [Meristemomyces frigidus]